MKTSTLENKTVRPGMMRYSFYASDRRPVSQAYKTKPQPKRRGNFWGTFLIVLILAAGVAYAFKPTAKVAAPTAAKTVVTAPNKTTTPTAAPAVAAPAPTNYCAGNTLNSFVKVSISQRHLWACQGTQQVYDTPVVTGIDYLAADKTPTGTYKIYGKYTNRTLRGSDSTGSWNDYVNYWMPFLHNKYGNYGLHDATWRDNNAFGNIDPNSADASHGCVELPLTAAKWLYGWSTIGTTVTVES